MTSRVAPLSLIVLGMTAAGIGARGPASLQVVPSPTRLGSPEVIRGEVIYPIASSEVWRQMRGLFRDLKLSTDTLDDAHQVLITKSHQYRGVGLPESSTLALPEGLVPASFQFHLYVAPGLEPARVAVGSILDAENPDARRQPSRSKLPRATIYGHPALTDWLLAKLSERLGAKPEPLGGRPDYRAEQARRLMPLGVVSPCGTQPAGLIGDSDRQRPGFKMPRVVSQVKPVYPGPELTAASQSVILLEGEITEHGTVINAKHLKPENASDNFSAASQFAAALWRFEPGVLGECPVRTVATFEMSFIVK